MEGSGARALIGVQTSWLALARLVLLLALGSMAPDSAAARLTLVVVARPAEAGAPSTLTLGANVNGWNPAAPGFAFSPAAPGQPPRLVLTLTAGSLLEFKVTRGSWERVETRADGAPLPNRRHRVRGDATLTLRVARWADAPGASPVPHTVTGRLDSLRLHSPQLDTTRDVLVWLPPGYEQATERYPVLYMHDGRNLFDIATSFVGQEWRVDESATAEARRGRALIVVGIAAAGGAERLSEYSPFPLARLEATGKGEAYGEFLVRTLKPHIDAHYRTRPERAATGIGGSSMGGHISLYLVLRHPETFGFAALFSPSLWFAEQRLSAWLHAQPRQPAPARIYLDTGTREGDNERDNVTMVAQTRALAEVLRARGHALRYDEVRDARHNEDAWARRVPAALGFFLDALPSQGPPQ
jgi:predicted alpha/beta superfamily hydrolase